MMMLWPGAHRRLRESLSAYIDGELEAPAVERLEGHLAGCAGCRLELAQLRATATALGELPAVEAPRSFALSPERAGGRRAPAVAAAPLALGVRLAAAGVAVALAAVVVVDLGGIGDGNGAGTTAPGTVTQRDSEYSAPTGAAAPGLDDGSPAPPESSADDRGAGTPSQPSEPAKTAAEGGGGIDALTAAEIALAVTLGLLVLGGFALAYSGRKK